MTLDRTLRLTANNDPFVQVKVGTEVLVEATLSPKMTATDGRNKIIIIRRRRAGSIGNHTVRTCGTASVVGGHGCFLGEKDTTPGKWYYQAFLVDKRHLSVALVMSKVVTVTWVEGDPTEATIEAGGAVRRENIETGALECVGSGYSQGTSCFVNVAKGSTVTVRATLNADLPAGWSWHIEWQITTSNIQTFPCSKTAQECTATVTEPQGNPSPIAVTHIDTPRGWTGPAMYVVPT